MKCLGITKGGSRCSRRPKYEHEFTRGCTTNVCYQHRSPRIITDWDRAIRNGSARDRPPQEIDNWLENFYEHWNKTNDIAASTRFASATYSLNATVCNYEMKYEIYVESVFKDTRVREPCNVCYKESGVFNTVSCDHPFCKDCIREWMTRSATCPVCRTIL
tara:strand:+ start:594 stop:1076 length:483 start_codon:yes stop_codon:yes gene_type:complete